MPREFLEEESVTQAQAIDIHTHIVPRDFPAYTGSVRDIAWPSMAAAEPCHCHVMIQGKNYRTVHQSCWINEDRLKDMQEHEVQVQCLSPMPELLAYWLSPEDGRTLACFLNDTLATLVQAAPDRINGAHVTNRRSPYKALRRLTFDQGIAAAFA